MFIHTILNFSIFILKKLRKLYLYVQFFFLFKNMGEFPFFSAMNDKGYFCFLKKKKLVGIDIFS